MGLFGEKKVYEKSTHFVVFHDFFQNGTSNMVSFFCIELGGSIHFISAFNNPMNMNSFEEKTGK